MSPKGYVDYMKDNIGEMPRGFAQSSEYDSPGFAVVC